MSMSNFAMTSSGPFPPEIIQLIVYFLTYGWICPDGPTDSPSLGSFLRWGRIGGTARYATVNRVWQDAVERETFAELRLDRKRLAEANAILNGIPRRQKYVRTIWLNVVLPYPKISSLRVEASDERHNNHVLQETFEAFLSTLAHWTPGPPVKLYLDAFSPTDRGYRKQAPLAAQSNHTEPYLPLELEDPERVLRLGSVNVVTEIDMERNRLTGRRISGQAVCVLLARLPAVKKVSINWWTSNNCPEERNAFAQALAKVTHAIDYFHIAGSDSFLHRRKTAHELDLDEAMPDELSQSLGLLSLRLQNLDLYDVSVSDDIFLQHKQVATEIGPPVHWARLENFSLYYLPIAPSGKWLFDPGPGSLYDVGPTAVADPILQRRYLAAARAALEMPQLRDMTLVAQLNSDVDWHKFWYHCDLEKKVAMAVWTSSTGFVPEDEVLEAWREVPRKHSEGLGEMELEVQILNDEYAV